LTSIKKVALRQLLLIIELNHEMQWNEVLIMDSEFSYKKRLISEMIHIKRQQLPLNKQSDTDCLILINLS